MTRSCHRAVARCAVGLLFLVSPAGVLAGPPIKPPAPQRPTGGKFQVEVNRHVEGNWAYLLVCGLALVGVTLLAGYVGQKLRRERKNWRTAVTAMAIGAVLGGLAVGGVLLALGPPDVPPLNAPMLGVLFVVYGSIAGVRPPLGKPESEAGKKLTGPEAQSSEAGVTDSSPS